MGAKGKKSAFREMWGGNYNLVSLMTMNNFKTQYHSPFIGYLWIVLYPLIQLLIAYVVFSVFMRIDVPHYELFLLIGFIIWNFYADATASSIMFLSSKKSFIRQYKFNILTVVMSSVSASFISFMIQFILFVLLMIVLRVPFHWTMGFFVLYVVELFLLVLGVALFVVAFFPKYKDIDKIWNIFLQVTFWLTPVIYPISYVPEKWVSFYNLNLIARLINDIRQAVIYAYIPDIRHLIISAVLCILTFCVGLYVFIIREKYFAEDI
jgi:lipopolysaccharide transport system permease protein